MFDLKVHEVEVWLWCEVLHILLSKNNVTAEGHISKAVGETKDPEGVEYPGTDHLGFLDHLGAGDY